MGPIQNNILIKIIFFYNMKVNEEYDVKPLSFYNKEAEWSTN